MRHICNSSTAASTLVSDWPSDNLCQRSHDETSGHAVAAKMAEDVWWVGAGEL